MKDFVFKNLSICCIVLLTTSCASIVKGRNQEVSFQSTPADATVTINGRAIGKTPITINLPKKTGQAVVFEKAGYKPLTFSLETRTSGWFWGNIVFGGFLGSTTDAATGSVYEYSPSQYIINLEPSEATRISASTQKSRDERAKEFIIVAYNSIRTDLNSGNGSYLVSLLNLLSVPEVEREEATKKIKFLADNYPDILNFADSVVKMFPATEKTEGN